MNSSFFSRGLGTGPLPKAPRGVPTLVTRRALFCWLPSWWSVVRRACPRSSWPWLESWRLREVCSDGCGRNTSMAGEADGPFAVMRLIQSLGYECLAVQLKGCSATRWVPQCAWSARQRGTWGPSMLGMATGTAIQAWVPCSVRSDRRPLSTSRPSIDPPLSGRPCLPVLGRYLPPTSRSHI